MFTLKRADIGHGNSEKNEFNITIKDLAELIQKTVGHKGEIDWDNSKPNGTPKKLMDSGKLLKLGWKPPIALENGIQMVYENYLEFQEYYTKNG